MKTLAIILLFIGIPILSAFGHLSNIELLLNQILFVLFYKVFFD